MRGFVAILLCLMILPVQMQLTDLIAVGPIRPDLSAAVVYAIGMVLGPWAGGGAGMVVGLLTDRFSGGLIGPQVIGKTLIGVGAAVTARTLLQASVLTHGAVVFALSFLQGAIMVIWIWWQTGHGWAGLYTTALPEACYTSLIVVCIVGVLRRLGVQPGAGIRVAGYS